MLPFTKRPGRGDESGDHDVVTKDEVAAKAPSSPPPPAAAPSKRPKFPSINDEEMTTLMPTKSLGSAVPSPRPAAGAPPPSRAPGSIPPPRSSATSVSRSAKFAAQLEDEEDGRTVVRGAPKIVKRGNSLTGSNAKMGMPTSPTTISPAAVIKATLESARAGVKKTGEHLMAPPPADLLEDIADCMKLNDDRHPADIGAEHTAILQSPTQSGSVPMVQGVKALSTQMLQPQPMAHGSIPPGSARPQTVPPPPQSNNHMGNQANQSGPYNAQQSGGYPAQYNGPVPSGSVSVPGVAMPNSMPAHFMVPQSPYSDGRMDPPATAVTARHKSAGRPAMSWAMAVAAFGIFVGVGAVAVMHGNNGEGFLETTASFVDPSRAAPKAAAAQPAAPPVTPTAVPVSPPEQPPTVGVPPVAVPAAPVAAAPAVATAAAPVAAAPVAAAPVAAAPVAAAPAAAAPAAAAPKPAFVAAAPRPAAAARPRATAAAAADDNTPPAPAPATAAATKPGKGGAAAPAKAPEMDDETKKALIELQKAQLERSLQ